MRITRHHGIAFVLVILLVFVILSGQAPKYRLYMFLAIIGYGFYTQRQYAIDTWEMVKSYWRYSNEKKNK